MSFLFDIDLFYLYVSSLTMPEWSTGAHLGTRLILNLIDSDSDSDSGNGDSDLDSNTRDSRLDSDSRLSDSTTTLVHTSYSGGKLM